MSSIAIDGKNVLFHVRYTASVYHYLRHLSRTGTRVYTKRPAFTQDLSLFTPYKSRNTVLFLGGKHSPESTHHHSFVSIESKWPVSANAFKIHRICFVYSFIQGREKQRKRERERESTKRDIISHLTILHT